MTAIQFAALRVRLSPRAVVRQLQDLSYLQDFRSSSATNKREVAKYLKNGWNTEFLLRLNADALTGDALRNSLHWAFPQAYYAVFMTTLAFYKVAGFTETTHAAVIRKVGALMKQGKYPERLSFLAGGGKSRIFHNIARSELPSTAFFDETDRRVCDAQICQFLNATREHDLKEKSRHFKFKAKTGKRKKALNHTEWGKVSERLGLTSILSLLYRKRIKSNYRDIDTYLSQHLVPEDLYNDLIQVVGCCNFVHEAFVCKGLGSSYYDHCLQDVRGRGYGFLTGRAKRIRSIAP